jgi:hypothetical protein
VDALPDQLSMLRGANWAVLEPGQVLADAADLLNVPTLLSLDGHLAIAGSRSGPVAKARESAADQHAALSAWAASIEPGSVRESLADGGGAVEVLQNHLRGWLDRHPPSGVPATAAVTA